jgi:GxxExxY protein
MQDEQQDKQENLLHFHLTRTILKCCFEVINTLGTGFLESVYKNSLQIALLDSGLKADPDRDLRWFSWQKIEYLYQI